MRRAPARWMQDSTKREDTNEGGRPGQRIIVEAATDAKHLLHWQSKHRQADKRKTVFIPLLFASLGSWHGSFLVLNVRGAKTRSLGSYTYLYVSFQLCCAFPPVPLFRRALLSRTLTDAYMHTLSTAFMTRRLERLWFSGKMCEYCVDNVWIMCE